MSLPEPYYSDSNVTLFLGDSLKLLPEMEAESVSAIVTDPPYNLGFMGKEWDSPGKSFVERKADRRNSWDHVGGNHNPTCAADQVRTRRVEAQRFQVWCTEWVAECLRVLKPGGHLLAFGGTRTWHRLTCAIEDAGFEIRDSVADLTGIDGPGLLWVYGSGFPKSQDAGRAVDMQVCQLPGRHFMRKLPKVTKPDDHVCPESPEGEPWRGYGTALKPGWEPTICARKPLTGTLGANLLTHGTGALNVKACQVKTADNLNGGAYSQGGRSRPLDGDAREGAALGMFEPGRKAQGEYEQPAGRWPPNIVLGAEAAAEMDRQSGVLTSGANPTRRSSDKFRDAYGEFAGQPECVPHRGADRGGASRFFPVFRYEAKAGADERPRLEDGTAHPTVKPVDLMAWLVRLVTPPGGLVLDPFAGSGATAEACIVEGFRCVLVEKDPKSADLIRKRLSKHIQPTLFGADTA